MKETLNRFDTISRYELIPNTILIGAENAFSIYSILIIPNLLGGIILYNLFGIRGSFFWVTVGLLALLLVNLYVYYKRTFRSDYVLKLIIDRNYIQIMSDNKIQFQAPTSEVTMRLIKCGKQNYSAIKIRHEEFQVFIIGFKESLPIEEHTIRQPLTQPDYWLKNKREWKQLYQQLLLKNTNENIRHFRSSNIYR